MVSEEMRRSATRRVSELRTLQNPLYMEIALTLYTADPNRIPYGDLVKTLMDVHSFGYAPSLDDCHTIDDYYRVVGGALHDLATAGIVNDRPSTEEVQFSLTAEGYKIIQFLVE